MTKFKNEHNEKRNEKNNTKRNKKEKRKIKKKDRDRKEWDEVCCFFLFFRIIEICFSYQYGVSIHYKCEVSHANIQAKEESVITIEK